MVKYFNLQGWSCLAWNFRGCSGEINHKLRFYHAGATDDFETVISHVTQNYHYPKIYLAGFSLGGNMILKYLGERGSKLPKSICRALCFSVPLDLHQSCLKISNGFNRVYSHRFLLMLKEKVQRKAKLYPGYFDLRAMRKVKHLIDFDHQFTAPLHGFKSAIDYYHQCSSQNFLDDINIPTLIVNATNDPFLSNSCYPSSRLKSHQSVELLVPDKGGHCGFADRNFRDAYWSEVLCWNYFSHP